MCWKYNLRQVYCCLKGLLSSRVLVLVLGNDCFDLLCIWVLGLGLGNACYDRYCIGVLVFVLVYCCVGISLYEYI